MFDIVVVETEALCLISIWSLCFQSLLMFCVNCNMMGHNLQNCKKLSSTNQSVGASKNVKKSQPETNKPPQNFVGSLADKPNASSMAHPLNNVDWGGGILVKDTPFPHVFEYIESSPKSGDAEKEGVKDVVAVGPVSIHDLDKEPPLTLQNSFDLLPAECEIPFGKAQLINKEQATFLSEEVITSVDEVLSLDKRKITITHEDPTLVQALPSELLGVSVIPATSIRTVNPDRLKTSVDTPGLTPMPQPITTSYASLTPDKLPSSQILVPASKSSFHSAAALKSVQILSKFWGEEVEEVMEDTFNHDKRLEMEDYPSLSESTKAEKKKKKHVNKVKPF